MVTRTSARSNVSVIPARVSGAREESRIPLADGGEGPGFFARQPRARMTEQQIEQDRNCQYDLQNSNSVICGYCPHPRVTAGVKKNQTPRPLAPPLGRGEGQEKDTAARPTQAAAQRPRRARTRAQKQKKHARPSRVRAGN